LPHIVYSIAQDMQLNLADRHLAELGLERPIELISRASCWSRCWSGHVAGEPGPRCEAVY